MNTQELRQNIEKVLGNNIRCLLPSYWWKKIFNQVIDTVENNALPIVKSEEDLKKLEVPEGSIASVVDSIVWKSFASFKLPSSDVTSLLSFPHIQKINVTNAPITVIPKMAIVLTDMQYMSQQNGKIIALGVEDDSVMGYGYSIVGGDVSGLIGPYTFRSAYSNNVNTTAVNALNSILSTSVFRFIGFELFSGNSDDEQAAINQLCSIFTWGDTSNGVYIKDEDWQRLALTTELPDISSITNIQVDDEMSSTSSNPVQNKVIKSYVDKETVTVGSTCQLYSNPGNITLRKGKGYIRNSSGQYIAAGDVVIKSLEYDDSFRDRILVFGGATSLTIPSNVLWENGITPVIDPEVIYVLNIKTGIVKGTTVSVATLNVYSGNPINSDSISKEIQDYVDSNCYDSRILYLGFANSLSNSLSEEELAYNIETYNKLIAHDKVLVYISGLSTSPLFPLTLISFNSIDKTIKFANPSNNDEVEVTYTLSSDGSATESIFSKLVGYDTYLSTTSDNAVQNKVITEALNNKVDKIQGKGLSSEDFTTELKQKLESISLIESVTWSELKTLRDSSTLSPGTLYRITDYVTTTSQPDTRSSGYGFDVVVLATSVNTLLEEAFVVKRDDDVYFTEHNSNLNAWKIWYCLDNDAERFAWASDTGKGVIYRMIDEFGNDCPYDFKNIQFKRWKITSSSSELTDHLSDIEGKYVGIMETDLFENYMPTYLTVPDVEDYKWLYTFSYAENDVILDLSLKPLICEYNIIKPCSQLNTLQKLNNIIIGGSLVGVGKNTFDPDCFCMTIGDVFSTGVDCFSNKFGQYCRGNIFINPHIVQNIFDDNLAINLFIGKVQQNIILKYFQSNKCFNDFTYNSINQHFQHNTINGVFTENVFGMVVRRNVFSGNIKHNNFGGQINDNILTDVSQCIFGFGFQDNYLNYALNTTGGVLFQNNNFARIIACTFGNGCRYNTSKLTNNLSGDTRPYIQGCTFGNYVWYTNLYNSIEGSNEQPIRCITIPSYFQGNETEYVHVEVPVNSFSEIKVTRNSQGNVKIYCEADLIE